MIFLGADLSLLSSGLVLLDDNYKILDQLLLIPPKGIVGVERLFLLESQLIEFLDIHEISFCCIESPAFDSKQGRLFDLGEWAGVFKLQLFKRGLQFIFAVPNQLKKYISGTAKSKKDTIMLDVYKKYGEEIRKNDLADGYVLARIARDYYFKYILNSDIRVKKYQEEVLLALKKAYIDQIQTLL